MATSAMSPLEAAPEFLEPPRSRASSRSTTSSRGECDVDDRIQCSFVEEDTIAEGKWLRLSNIKYRDPSGKEKVWEAVSRANRQMGEPDDCVGIIAVYQRLLHYDQIILVKQYRPALKAYTIEMPTGILDPGESAEAVALRELKEETGYAGEVKHVGPLVSLDPGISDCTIRLVTVMVNGDLPENFNNKVRPAEGELLEIIMVPLSEVLSKLHDLSYQGYAIDSRVHALAVGLSMGSKPLRKRSRHETTLPSFGLPDGLDRLRNDMPV